MKSLFAIAAIPTLLWAQSGAVRVPLIEVVSRSLQSTTALPGELRSFRAVDVYAKVSGFVDSVNVDRGSRVQAGDSLATITAPELLAQIAEAQARIPAIEAQIAESEAKRSAAEIRLGHLRKAAQTPGAIALSEIEMTEKSIDAENARIQAIRASADAARASVRALEAMLPYLRVQADFAGVIAERSVHEGSLVGPQSKDSDPMFRLLEIDRLRLVVAVSENLVGSIRQGARIRFSVPAYPEQRFTGTVARSAYSVDPATRTMPVELDVDNAGGRLAPGMYADVAWPMSRGRSSLLVPPSAIKSTTERIFVIRVTDGIAEWVDVRRGASDGNLVEVTGNLRAGDRIVARATDEIRPGTGIVERQ
jgi:membrane fusion protein, multidrug efflux system